MNEFATAVTQSIKGWHLAVTAAMLFFGTLTAFGWVFQKPSARLTIIEVEQRVQADEIVALQKNILSLQLTQEIMIRLQCLTISRRDAQIAGACHNLPTKDDKTP